MKSIKLFISLSLLSLFLSGTVFAKDMQSTIRVGVVDVSKILQGSEKVNDLKDNLTKKFKPRQDEILSAQHSLRKSLKKLERNRAVMSKKQLARLQEDITEQQKSLQKLQSRFQQDVFSAQSSGMKQIIQQLRKEIKAVATQQHYTLVLDKQAVAYVQPSNDITDSVIKLFK